MYNGQKKKNKMTKNNIQNIIQKANIDNTYTGVLYYSIFGITQDTYKDQSEAVSRRSAYNTMYKGKTNHVMMKAS